MYSKEAYRQLLDQATRSGYTFSGFLSEAERDAPTIYLRHDVDYSLDMAVELAGINAAAGVQGTFFVLLRSQVYNLLSYASLERVRELRAFNQRVAFHVALPSPLPDAGHALTELIVQDFQTVRRQIPDLEPVFSWHNPTPLLLRLGSEMTVQGLVNVYGPPFIGTVPYVSDSNLRYSVEQLEEIVGKKDHHQLHLLLHPFNWVAGGASMREVFAKTWQYVIREREREMRFNEKYRAGMPGGMPDKVLDAFSEEWLKAAGQQAE